jgi:hypothetical protein
VEKLIVDRTAIEKALSILVILDDTTHVRVQTRVTEVQNQEDVGKILEDSDWHGVPADRGSVSIPAGVVSVDCKYSVDQNSVEVNME